MWMSVSQVLFQYGGNEQLLVNSQSIISTQTNNLIDKSMMVPIRNSYIGEISPVNLDDNLSQIVNV